MWEGKFNPADRVIWVTARLHGPLGTRPYQFVLDTGCYRTIVDAGIVDELGYSPAQGKQVTRLVGAGSAMPGYTLVVDRLETMGLHLDSFAVVCQDLPRDIGVDGLLGMDIIEGRVLTVDAKDGRVQLTW